LLATNVLFAHVDVAFQSKTRADRRGGDAMLTGAGLGDDALLAHPPREQSLAEAIVDLVSAGVIQVLALEIDLAAVPCFGEPVGVVKRRRPSGVVVKKVVELRLKRRIPLRLQIGR